MKCCWALRSKPTSQLLRGSARIFLVFIFLLRLMFLSISFFLLWNKARQKENVDAETNQMLARLNQLLIDLRSRYSQPSQERNQAYMTPPRRRRNEDEIALRDYQLNFSE